MADCSVSACDQPVKVKSSGLCNKHYKRMRRTGSVDGATAETRFFNRITETESGCWIWDKPHPTGYGRFDDDKQKWLAHRWAYEFLRAEIPNGLVLDHLCRDRACVNPWHLEPVTDSVNVKRTYVTCPNGHAYTSDNTEIHSRGHRQCRICYRNRERRASRKQPAYLGG